MHDEQHVACMGVFLQRGRCSNCSIVWCYMGGRAAVDRWQSMATFTYDEPLSKSNYVLEASPQVQ